MLRRYVLLLALFISGINTAEAQCVTHTTQTDFASGASNNVDITTIPHAITLQSNASQATDQAQLISGGTGYDITAAQWIGQSFIPAISGKLTKIDLGFSSTGMGSCRVDIYAASAGSDLPALGSLATATFQFYSSYALYSVTFPTSPCLTAGTKYVIVCKAPLSGSTSTWHQYCVPNPQCNPYANGTTVLSPDAGATWTTKNTDCVFRTYIDTYSYSTSGSWTSPVIAALGNADWTTLSWNASVLANTTLKFQVATSNSAAGPYIFVGPDCTSATFYTTTPGNNILDAGGPGVPPYFCTYAKRYLKYIAYFATTNPGGGGCVGGGGLTPTLYDATVCYSAITCNTPIIQASNIIFSNITASSTTLTWTNGDGNKRIVKIHPLSSSFINPIDGTDPVANSFYSGGGGEQVMYNGSGNSVTITGLEPSTNYAFEVWEGNCSGSSVKWMLGTSTGNPNSVTTLVCSPPSVTAYANPTELCGSGSVQLFGNGANTYTWSIVAGAGTTLTGGSGNPTGATGSPVAANLAAPSSTFQVVGCIGPGNTCCSTAPYLTVNASTAANLYPGPINDMTKSQGFEPTAGSTRPAFSCTSNASNTGSWSAVQTTQPSTNDNFWMLRTSSLGSAPQCIFAWGASPNNTDVNLAGNSVISNSWSLTCEGYKTAPNTIYNGYNFNVVTDKRAVLQLNGTGYGAYNVAFNYIIGGDIPSGVKGMLEYSLDNITWTTLQTYERAYTSTASSVTLPTSASNITTLYIGWRFICNGVNAFDPAFTIDDIKVSGSPIPTPPAPPSPTGSIGPLDDYTTFVTTPGANAYIWSITAGTGTLNGSAIYGSGNTALIVWSGTQTPGTYNICVQTQSACGALSAPSCITIAVPVTTPPINTLCPGGSRTLASNISGLSYQWQMSTDSITFNNISDNSNFLGTNSGTLYIQNIPSSWYGHQFRCVVNGITNSSVYTIIFTNFWTGSVNTSWENPANWSCGSVPDGYTDVVIGPGMTVVLNSNTSVGSLTLDPSSSFTVNPPYTLTILGH